MEVDAAPSAVPSTSKWVASAAMGPTNGPPSLAEFYSDLESRIEASLASLAHNRGSTDDFASDSVLREAFQRVWSGLERPEGNETWKIEAVDRALEAAVLRRSDEASVYGTALFDALDLHLIHLEERLCNEVLFQLIDQVVDQQTIDGAERVFSYVERRISRIYTAHWTLMPKSLQLLRLCNELLRRCSRHTRTVFCGRILQLLSSTFPVAEKSGVNLSGQPNLSNVTVYEKRDVDSETGSQLLVPTDDTRTAKSLTSLSKLIDRLSEAAPAKKAERPFSLSFPRSEEYKRILIVYKESNSTEPLDLITTTDGKLRFHCHKLIESIGGLKSESRTESEDPRNKAWDKKTLVVTKIPPKEPTPEAAPAEEKMDEDQPTPSIDVEAEAEKAAIRKATEFYETFWSLQEYMTDVSLLVDPRLPEAKRNFEQLKSAVPKVLEAFTASSNAEKALTSSAAKGDRKGKAKAAQIAPVLSAEEIRDDYFFSKYLTGKGLLDLQINDLYFRRQILVQLLILFHYLLNTRLDASGRPVVNGGTPLLNDADERWLKEYHIKVKIELRTSGSDGIRFVETVELILAREANWVKWKLEKCPSDAFQKPSLPNEAFEQARTARRRILEPYKPYAHRVGTPQLSKLWQQSITLDDLVLPAHKNEREAVRKYREKLERIEAGDEGLRLSELGRDRIKGSVAWRALRTVNVAHSSALLRPLAADKQLESLEIELSKLDGVVVDTGNEGSASAVEPSGENTEGQEFAKEAGDTAMAPHSATVTASEALADVTSPRSKRERSNGDEDDGPAKRLRSTDASEL